MGEGGFFDFCLPASSVRTPSKSYFGGFAILMVEGSLILLGGGPQGCIHFVLTTFDVSLGVKRGRNVPGGRTLVCLGFACSSNSQEKAKHF